MSVHWICKSYHLLSNSWLSPSTAVYCHKFSFVAVRLSSRKPSNCFITTVSVHCFNALVQQANEIATHRLKIYKKTNLRLFYPMSLTWNDFYFVVMTIIYPKHFFPENKNDKKRLSLHVGKSDKWSHFQRKEKIKWWYEYWWAAKTVSKCY